MTKEERGRKLEKYLEQRGYTKYRFAKEIDISRSAIGNIIEGKTDPKASTIIAMEDKLLLRRGTLL